MDNVEFDNLIKNKEAFFISLYHPAIRYAIFEAFGANEMQQSIFDRAFDSMFKANSEQILEDIKNGTFYEDN